MIGSLPLIFLAILFLIGRTAINLTLDFWIMGLMFYLCATAAVLLFVIHKPLQCFFNHARNSESVFTAFTSHKNFYLNVPHN